MKKFGLLTACLLLLAASPATRADGWSSSEAMTRAAEALLETLDSEQRKITQFSFDAAERGTWSNLPIMMVPPPGLLLKDMNDEQRAATQTLLSASMSSQGYAKFTGVMRLEALLHDLAIERKNNTPESEHPPILEALIETRDPGHYAVAVFGAPGDPRWGWKLAGHHAAANFTVFEGRIAFTPTFLGSSPRIVETGPYAGMMAMPKEGDRGIQLMESLSDAQREKALITEELTGGIASGPGRQNSLQDYEGLPAGEMTAGQKRMLRALVEEYVRNAEYDAADAQLQAIEAAGWDALWFAWRGPVDSAGRFYYRVHGPRLLIEYHRVDPNHDHSIVRDPGNDYGADWLGKHLEEHHPTQEEIREAVRERIGER